MALPRRTFRSLLGSPHRVESVRPLVRVLLEDRRAAEGGFSRRLPLRGGLLFVAKRSRSSFPSAERCTPGCGRTRDPAARPPEEPGRHARQAIPPPTQPKIL